MRIRPGKDYTHRLVYIIGNINTSAEVLEQYLQEIKAELILNSSDSGSISFDYGFNETDIQGVFRESNDNKLSESECPKIDELAQQVGAKILLLLFYQGHMMDVVDSYGKSHNVQPG